MITLKEAEAIAKEYKRTELPADKAWDAGDSFVIGFITVRDDEGYVIPGQGPVVVNKESGKAESFFPPDYPAGYINDKNRIF